MRSSHRENIFLFFTVKWETALYLNNAGLIICIQWWFIECFCQESILEDFPYGDKSQGHNPRAVFSFHTGTSSSVRTAPPGSPPPGIGTLWIFHAVREKPTSDFHFILGVQTSHSKSHLQFHPCWCVSHADQFKLKNLCCHWSLNLFKISFIDTFFC